jgi:hypothetical protein
MALCKRRSLPHAQGLAIAVFVTMRFVLNGAEPDHRDKLLASTNRGL